MIRVLIVHGCPLFRLGLSRRLACEADIEVVGEPNAPAQILTSVETLRPDVILLDGNLSWPDGDALALAWQIRLLGGQGIFVFAPALDEELFFRYLQYGAAAYEPSTISAEDLVAKIRQLAGGVYLMSDALFTRELPAASPLLAHAPRRSRQKRAPLPPPLSGEKLRPEAGAVTARELEVLRLIMQNRTNKQIALALGLSDQTVKNHITVLLKKLGAQNRTGAITTALRRKLVSLDEVQPDDLRVERYPSAPRMQQSTGRGSGEQGDTSRGRGTHPREIARGSEHAAERRRAAHG